MQKTEKDKDFHKISFGSCHLQVATELIDVVGSEARGCTGGEAGGLNFLQEILAWSVI